MDQIPTNRPEDPRSSEELFAAALEGDYDDHAPWEAVAALRLRGTEEVFEVAKRNAASGDPKNRARALDVLGQLGAGKPDTERPYKSECIATAIRLTKDANPHVVHQATYALAHLGGDEAVSTLLSFKADPNPGIRQAVALGLHGGESKSPKAIAALIELMDDQDDHVRDWATFALGQGYPPQDSPAIRDALRKRLNDTFADARSEAIWGLAIRKDPQGLQLLLDRLDSDNWTQGDEIAAEESLDRDDNPRIEELREGIRKLLPITE